MNGSRFFVLKMRWIRIDDKDWGISYFSFGIISRFQRFNRGEDTFSWGVAPGFNIVRRWRTIQDSLRDSLFGGFVYLLSRGPPVLTFDEPYEIIVPPKPTAQPCERSVKK